MRNAFFDKLRPLFRCCSAVNRPFLGIAVVDLACFFSKAGADVFEIFFNVVMHPNQHLLELSRRWRRGWTLRCLRTRQRFRMFFFLHVNGAGVGQLLNSSATAGWTGDQLFLGLLLIFFVAWKPGFETMLFFAEKIVDNHRSP